MEQDTFTHISPLSLAEVVTRDSRAAAVFERFGLDYCCQGRRTIDEASAARGVSATAVKTELAALGEPAHQDANPAEWNELDLLTHFIITHHHEYVRQSTPAIVGWLQKLVSRHGGKHPELAQVQQCFLELCDDLLTHMIKEENVLFPYIDDLARASRNNAPSPATPFGTISNPIRVMEADHQRAGDLMVRLRSLTHDYMAPDDACTTYRLCYAELARFEFDLHRHVHLENHVLFPRAAEIEARFA